LSTYIIYYIYKKKKKLNVKLIAITGNIGSGKSTLLEYIDKNYYIIKYNFADPIKEIGLKFGFGYKQLYGNQKDKLKINKIWNISGRKFMQLFGTEISKIYFPKVFKKSNLENCGIWSKIFENFYLKNNDSKTIIIGDLRFKDEEYIIKKYSGVIIKIIRVNNTNLGIKHSSELYIKDIKPTHIIHNNLDLNNLYNEIDKILLQYKK